MNIDRMIAGLEEFPATGEFFSRLSKETNNPSLFCPNEDRCGECREKDKRPPLFPDPYVRYRNSWEIREVKPHRYLWVKRCYICQKLKEEKAYIFDIREMKVRRVPVPQDLQEQGTEIKSKLLSEWWPPHLREVELGIELPEITFPSIDDEQ